MESVYLVCGARGPQLKRDPLGGPEQTARKAAMNPGRCSSHGITIIRRVLIALFAQVVPIAQAQATRPVQSAGDSAQPAFFAVPSGGSRSAGKVTVKVSGRDTHGAV